MALSDLSFKLYTDSGLTSLFGGTITLTHKTDLSDNPQDTTLYFGSPTADRALYATSNPGVDNIVLTPTDVLPVWQASTAYILGQDAQPTVSNGKRYEVTVAGTSSSSEPTWPTSVGSTVTDGTVTWQCMGNKHTTSEIKLALTSGDLSSAVAGAALSLGPEILSTSAEAVELHVRITNAVTIPSAAGVAEIGININAVQEESV